MFPPNPKQLYRTLFLSEIETNRWLHCPMERECRDMAAHAFWLSYSCKECMNFFTRQRKGGESE